MKYVCNFVSVICFLFLFEQSRAQEAIYRIQFEGSKDAQFSVHSPEKFLSQRAINRRLKYKIPIDETDLPVNSYFIDSLKRLGLQILHVSKWLNSATVATNDTELMDTIHRISFITSTQLTKPAKEMMPKRIVSKFEEEDTETGNQDEIEVSENQLKLHHGDYLHQKKCKGEGMQIAIFDAGFSGVDVLPSFAHLIENKQILGTYSFVYNNSYVFDYHTHGTMVLGLLVAQHSNYHPSAPNASYWLLQTEDGTSEYIVEEDNWVAAAEFADSAGVDIFTTSLGYSEFNLAQQNHQWSDLNGKTSRIAIASTMASEKGILVVNSAGNSGNKAWKYITTPADAQNILAVGATDIKGEYAYFSSLGYPENEQIKPDIAAFGYNVATININNNIQLGSGTSFAAPIISGLSACLWQAFPTLSNVELMDVIKKSADQYRTPDFLKGYGVPNFAYAFGLMTAMQSESTVNELFIYPNPLQTYTVVEFFTKFEGEYNIRIFDLAGRIVKTVIVAPVLEIYSRTELNLSDLQTGIYFMEIKNGDKKMVKRVVKLR